MQKTKATSLKAPPDIGERALSPHFYVSPPISKSAREVLSIKVYTENDAAVVAIRQKDSISPRTPLYSEDERRRRDSSPWTIVQGILAPLQFAIFLISVVLVARYLLTGQGLALATASIVIKTIALYTIMITGCMWEHAVFGRYLFAKAFFWEDVFSMLVLTLHTAYLIVLMTDALDARGQMYLALAAYATYVINAGQFLLKLRAARLDRKEKIADPLSGLRVTQ